MNPTPDDDARQEPVENHRSDSPPPKPDVIWRLGWLMVLIVIVILSVGLPIAIFYALIR